VPARARLELLGVQAKGGGDTEHAVHHVARSLVLADDRESRDEPERADQEAALLAGQTVVGLVGAVAQDEAVLPQFGGDRVDRLAKPLVASRQEPEQRREERRGV
jgi:hypothetical protein